MAPELRHHFTDRRHGDLAVGGEPSSLARRRAAVAEGPWTWLRQVHGAEVVTVTRPGEWSGASADAAVTMTPGAVLAVQTADCAPILLTGAGGFAVVHAGWRGLLAGVVEKAADALQAAGTSPEGAVLGPCIRGRCYQFGSDELDLVAGRYGPTVRTVTAEGTPALDLSAAITTACGAIGLPVTDTGTCTACSPVHWSHRARGDHQRQALVAWMEP